MSITSIVRNLSELVEDENHFDRLIKIGMPSLQLILLAYYYKRSDNITQGLLMSLENLISLSYEMPDLMTQFELFSSKEGI